MRAVLSLLAFAFASCSDPAPRWIPLARGFRPAPLRPLVERWQAQPGSVPARIREPLAGVSLSTPLSPAAWRRADDGTWRYPLPGGAFAYGLPGFLSLSLDKTAFQRAASAGALPPGHFRAEGGELVLALPADRTPPDGLVLELRLEQGRASEESVWQLRLEHEFAAGLPVWHGETTSVSFDLPADCALRGSLRFYSRAPEAEVVVRVHLEGDLLLETRASSAHLATTALPFQAPLPAARAGARLDFSFDGPPGCLVILNPLVGPRDFGTYDARPFARTRPDIVLFLADTFRADNLALHGGDPAWTPNLDRFAARALACTNARSNAAWTLPSVASLLSGFAPGQHTATGLDYQLPDRLVTLAERLARAGYRTGAVTDAAFVSPNYGLDQGFEHFLTNDSAHWDLDWTLARAREFLAADDGRPVFLLVHSYRAHMPFRVGPEEDSSAYDALQARYQFLVKKNTLPPEERRALVAEAGPLYTPLYRAGAQDVDRGFGELLGELERLGIAREGVILFTADHGEALGENDDYFHDGELWDSKLRVPLLLSAPGLAPRRLEPAVTLLDVAPTLARLAGLAPDPDWLGQDLAEVTAERPALAFRLGEIQQLALVESGRKLLAHDLDALEQGRFDAAYELTHDPREERPLTEAAWAGELARRNATLVRRSRDALVDPTDALIHPDIEKNLKDLGYGGR
jgi:arylsulfatase A-like enzyme